MSSINLDKPCPYCKKEQKLSITRNGFYKLNQSHRTCCPLANTVFKEKPATEEGAQELVKQWNDLVEEGVNSDKIINLLDYMERLLQKVSELDSVKEKLEKYESKSDYNEMVSENERLRTPVNSLTSERSKWLRKLKRAGVKV